VWIIQLNSVHVSNLSTQDSLLTVSQNLQGMTNELRRGMWLDTPRLLLTHSLLVYEYT